MFKTATLLALLSASYGAAQTTSVQAPAPSTSPASGSSNGACQPPTSSFNITAYQLYPENADFDADRCVVYYSVLYNATIAVYDVREKRVTRTIEVPPLSHNPDLHASGVQYDRAHARLSFMLNAGAAFDTNGENITGSNFVVSYDLEKNEVRFTVDLSEHAKPGLRGFQDMEHDKDGNIFVIGSFGGSMLRVDANDKSVTEWYASSALAPQKGLTGAAKYNESTLLVTDQSDRQIYRFSMDEKDKREKITLSGAANLSEGLDGVYLPPKYNNNVLLVSDSDEGVIVLSSRDGWATAQWIGTVPNQYLTAQPFRGFTAASVQIGDRIFAVTEWFLDNEGTKPGNRTEFPMVDITEQVDQLLSQSPARAGVNGTNIGSASLTATGASARLTASLGVLGVAAGLAFGLAF